MTHRKRIGVLRGGPSNEYEVSLQTGANVLSVLREKFDSVYEARDIFIDRKGKWHIDGIPAKPEEIIRKIDIAFNALHGTYGEDGKIQSFFEAHSFPFTGSGALGSALGMNKALTKKVLQDHGLKVALSKTISSEDITKDVDAIVRLLFTSFILPGVVKPNASGSSVGVSIVKDYSDLPKALNEAAKHSDTVLIEEFIPGIEATCGVIENFRGQALYALPPVEIRPKTQFFDYEAKYQGKSEEIVPATFSDSNKKKIETMAREIHNALGLRHYSRSDFIIHPRRGIYVLEVNTLPGLTGESLIPKALRAIGSNVHELVAHLIGLAEK